MKKFLSLATALLLVCALAVFAGCGRGGTRSGVIEGNYVEPTKAELQSALDSIDEEKLLGDMDAAGWKTGASLGANLLYEMNMAGEKVSMSFDLSHKISAEIAENALELKGEGKMSMETNAAGVKEKVSATTYNDMENIYIAATVQAGGVKETEKIRIGIADILGDYGDLLPTEPDVSGEATLPADADALLQELAANGFTLAMDVSDGIKIKLSANESAFSKILDEMNGSMADAGIPGTGDLFTFSEDSYMEFYLHVDADGFLKKAAARIDLNGSFDLSSVMGEIEGLDLGTMSMIVRGAFELEIGEVSVNLPTDFSDYTPYM